MKHSLFGYFCRKVNVSRPQGRNTLHVTLTSRWWIEKIWIEKLIEKIWWIEKIKIKKNSLSKFLNLILVFLLYKFTIESTYANLCLVAAPLPPSVCVCVCVCIVHTYVYLYIYVSIHA
jgi:hypothetical protein